MNINMEEVTMEHFETIRDDEMKKKKALHVGAVRIKYTDFYIFIEFT